MTAPSVAGTAGRAGGEDPARVVVVDDDPVGARVLETMLRNDGCSVTVHGDARAALAAMEKDPPDVLVSDWVMPGMDGPDLLREVRKSRALQSVYCVLVTAHDEGGRKIAGLLVGADDYLAKPVSETELLTRVRVGLRVRRLERRATMLAVAATLGHEINNPLTGVMGYADLARAQVEAGDREKALESLKRVEEAADRIREVVARLVALRDPALKRYLPGSFMVDAGGGKAAER